MNPQVLLGAGMMALPRAMLILGFLPGLLILLAVCALTYYTLRGKA